MELSSNSTNENDIKSPENEESKQVQKDITLQELENREDIVYKNVVEKENVLKKLESIIENNNTPSNNP